MDLTIIIVNWNTRELLKNCLRSIADNGSSLQVQTIVVDNNSADGSREMVSECFPVVKLLNSGANLGFARANNLGLPFAAAPAILFLNPDTELSGEALEAMVRFLQNHPDVGALGCKIKGLKGEIKPLGLQWYPTPLTEAIRFFAVSDHSFRTRSFWLPHHDPERSGFVKKLYGACLLVRKEVLDKIGSFDERFFMYCEDVDLCRRIRAGGWRIYYMSDVCIMHLGGSSSSQAPGAFAVLMTCESLEKFMRKHYGFLGAVCYRAVAFAGSSFRFAVLYLASLLSSMGLRIPVKTALAGSLRKNMMILRWTLGLQRAVVHQSRVS